jgi:hypothetical protein
VYAPFVDLAYRNCWRYLDAFMSGSWEGSNVALLSPLLRYRKGKEGDPSLEVSSLKSISTKATNQGAARVQQGRSKGAARKAKLSPKRPRNAPEDQAPFEIYLPSDEERPSRRIRLKRQLEQPTRSRHLFSV